MKLMDITVGAKSVFFFFKMGSTLGGEKVKVCYTSNLPRHSIIAWMTILDMLPTKDRLISMGLY